MSETGAWMPMYWADYFGDTMHLSTEQHGAYLLLIGTYWRRGKPLPDDDKWLANVTKMHRNRWGVVRKTLEGLFDIEPGVCWRHKRLEKEIHKSSERLQSARAAGKAGGLAKSKLTTTTYTDKDSVLRTDAKASACKQVDPKKVVYDSGKSLLQAYGVANGAAGGMITKWLKQHDPPEVMQAIMTAGEKERHNVIEFIAGVLKNGEQTGETEAERVARLVAKFDARGPGEV